MIAPMRCADSMPAATTSSSIDSSFDSGFRQVTEKRRPAEMRQRAADVGLKQHDDRDHHVTGEVANQPVDGPEARPARAVKERDEHAGAERHLHGAGAANQLQRLVDDERHHEDVEDVPPSDGRPPSRLVIQSIAYVLCAFPNLSRPLEPPAPSRRPRAPARYGRRRAPPPPPSPPCPSRAPVADAGRAPRS